LGHFTIWIIPDPLAKATQANASNNYVTYQISLSQDYAELHLFFNAFFLRIFRILSNLQA
jgi:hypothetical protein